MVYAQTKPSHLPVAVVLCTRSDGVFNIPVAFAPRTTALMTFKGVFLLRLILVSRSDGALKYSCSVDTCLLYTSDAADE